MSRNEEFGAGTSAPLHINGPFASEDGHSVLYAEGENHERHGAVEFRVRDRKRDPVVEIHHLDAHTPRRGVATALMDHLVGQYPQHRFDPLNLSDSGAPFWDSYSSRRPGLKQ